MSSGLPENPLRACNPPSGTRSGFLVGPVVSARREKSRRAREPWSREFRRGLARPLRAAAHIGTERSPCGRKSGSSQGLNPADKSTCPNRRRNAGGAHMAPMIKNVERAHGQRSQGERGKIQRDHQPPLLAKDQRRFSRLRREVSATRVFAEYENGTAEFSFALWQSIHATQ